MSEFSDNLSDRFMKLVLGILEIEDLMNNKYSCRHIFGQLFRAGTSAGANYEEARAGASNADFIYKLQIVLKELRESVYWICIISEAKLLSKEKEIHAIQTESRELANIIAKCIYTAKSRSKKP